MIKLLNKDEYSNVYEFIRKDSARNYFIRLAFESKKEVFENIYGEFDNNKLKAVLLKRKSGNLQFYADGDFDIEGFSEILRNIEFKSLISPSSYCDKFLNKNLFSNVKNGAIIAKLKSNEKVIYDRDYEINILNVDDLDEVVRLYEKVFKGFTKKEVMKEKIITKRGRGVCIKINNRIVSVAQTEFENDNSAIIVGVATSKEHQKKGLASACLKFLCNKLINEQKDLYLQYDNKDAGKIYERIGFKPIDRVKHYFK